MIWDADLYLRYEDERTRPAIDLASRIAVADPRTIVDLGCGPGNSTQILRRVWPAACVRGVDRSADMIAAARQAHPDQEWIQADIEHWSPEEPVDIVFLNAVLQWLGDHRSVVRRLFGFVAPGGALAFQIPSDAYALVRRFIQEVADNPLWSAQMDGARAALTMESSAFYYDSLAGRGRSVDIWETEYSHSLDSPSAIVEWIAGTGLRPFLEPLDGAGRERFVALLTDRVTQGYPLRSDGRVLFPFRRLFVVAYA